MFLDSFLRYLDSRRTRRERGCRPQQHRRRDPLPRLDALEDRLPLGDTLMSPLLAAAWFGASLEAVLDPAAMAKPATATPVGRICHPSGQTDGWQIRPTESTAAAWGSEIPATLPAPTWDALTNLFAPAARRQHGTSCPSPQREQGVEPQPALIPRAGEGSVTSRLLAPPPLVIAPRHSDDALLATLAALHQPAAPARAADATPTQEAQVKERFEKLPLYFEQNVGQTDAQVHFFTRGPSYGLYLTSTEAVMVLSPPKAAEAVGQDSDPAGLGWQDRSPAPQGVESPPAVVRMQLVGSNPAQVVSGRDEQPGKVNYFLGNDPAQWHTNIATFGRVEYDDVYPGIDLVWYGTNRQLEYDFVVAPGADPSQIRVRFAHAARLELDAGGDLLVQAGDQTLRQHKPVVYQDLNGTRQPVASRFVLDEASGTRQSPEVRFALGAYDAARPLVIDPVLSYSTYVGGGNYDFGYGIAVDADGNGYIMGRTLSILFPTANPFQPTYGGDDGDAFVTKVASDGATLVYSTYLGGHGTEQGSDVAVDADGNAYVTGVTDSTNFPTANAFQPTIGGGFDAFVTKLAADGASLVYSTYLGGSGIDIGDGIAVNAAGNAYVTGTTTSTNFPTADAFQPACGGCNDAFVTKLAAAGASLVYSTYLGGSGPDPGKGIAVDAAGNAYVTGWTDSTNFPTANAIQPTSGGGYDAFVTKLAADGASLVYSTYLGGRGDDHGEGIAVDAAGNVYVTGDTASTNFPTANAIQPTSGGGYDAFVTKLAADGASLVYSTYLGGRGNEDRGFGIALDVADNAYVTGWTDSTDFPTANPFQPALGGRRDAFVTKLDAEGATLVYSTYLGGSNTEWGLAIAVDAAGNAYITGTTQSPNFPTTPGAFDRTCGADGQCNYDGYYYYDDTFVTRIGSAPVAYYYVYPDSGEVTAGVPFDLYVLALDAGFNIIPDYTGEIVFWSTDPKATTPVYYQFQRSDQGIASFKGGVTFRTAGTQELYVFDWPGIGVYGYAAYEVQGG